MSNVTEDVYQRLQKMLEDKQKTKVIIPDMFMDEKESYAFQKLITQKIQKYSDIPEHHADILADHIIGLFKDFMYEKAKKAKQNAENPSNDKFSPMFRRVEE